MHNSPFGLHIVAGCQIQLAAPHIHPPDPDLPARYHMVPQARACNQANIATDTGDSHRSAQYIPTLFHLQLPIQNRQLATAGRLCLGNRGNSLGLVVVQLRHLLDSNCQLVGHGLDANRQLLRGLLSQAGNGGVQLVLGGQVLAALQLRVGNGAGREGRCGQGTALATLHNSATSGITSPRA